MTRLLLVVLIAAAVCMVSAGMGAADDVNVTLEGHFGGFTCACAVSGDYAYIGQGQDLVVLDVSSPASPVELGRVMTPDIVLGVAVSGDYAYVADYYNGLVIVDVSDRSAPTLAGSYDTGYAWDVVVSGNYAYVADGSNGLVIVDVSDRSAPTLAGSYNTAGYAYGVAVSGDYAYVADWDNGLVILRMDASGADTTPPTLTITSPAPDTTTHSPTITIAGTASDPSGIASVTVNGALASGTVDWSTWSADVTLAEGENAITVVATNNTGGSTIKSVTVTYTTIDGVEIAYDDGSAEGGWSMGYNPMKCTPDSDGGNNGYALRMTTPNSEPFTINVIKVFSMRYGEDCKTRFEIWDHDKNTLYSDIVPHSEYGSLVIPVKSISVISQVNNEYPFKSRCMR